jgi:hypothetical protein
MAGTVLSRRALNRALLARQMLLQRRPLAPLDAVEHLVGMQAQEPQAPYIGLWDRLDPFDPQELSDLIDRREAVRASVMRTTIHLLSARDARVLAALAAPVRARTHNGGQFAKPLAGVAIDELVRVGRDLLATEPRSRADLSRLLAERWPGVDPASLSHAVIFLTPVVQVPPRGLWRQGGQARWAMTEEWLGSPLEKDSAADDVVLRYLAAFGPASVMDIQAWSGLTRLKEVTARLASRLRTFEDESGNQLLDVADGELPDPDTPAPARILPPFDNAILAHADRSRIITREQRDRVFRDRLMRTFLIDGFVAGTWRIDGGTFSAQPFAALKKKDRGALAAEAKRLLAFAAPDATPHEVAIAAA